MEVLRARTRTKDRLPLLFRGMGQVAKHNHNTLLYKGMKKILEIINQRAKTVLLAALPIGGVVSGLLLSSCSDWDDHYVSTSDGSHVTLWEQMQQHAELSDFCQVLQQVKVFRMHRKTSVSYADLLNSGQSFTVVAPVNGTFNSDSLIRLSQTAQGDSVVEKFFVLNHISRSATSVKENEQRLQLLNSKHVTISAGDKVLANGGFAGAIEGISLRQANIHTKNGVLHIIEHPLPYEYSLYEALCDQPDMQSIGAFLRLYDEDWFDADASVSSGIVEGVPVYVDSVVIERNRLLQQIGLINVEDSTYWMVAPTEQGWRRAYDAASQYFVYDASVLRRDSIQQYWINRSLLEDAVFNLTDQKSTFDSLVSVPYLSWRRSWVTGKPVYHVFQHPFAPDGILYGAQSISCSNGMLYKVSEWPFDPMKTYFKELWSEGESTWLITAEKDCTYNGRRQVADSISENSYLQILPRTNTSNWSLTFRINNTLSGMYDICAVLLPKSVSNQNNPDDRPCKFKAAINYVDLDGKSQSFNCDNVQFLSDPERVDTIVLAEAFQFPACNYDQQDIKVSVTLTCSILARETSRYAREMYLDCIYLRPRKSASQNNNE